MSGPITAAALAFGIASFAVACLASSFRHFGGTDTDDAAEQPYVCEAWWYQISSPDGVATDSDLPSPACRDAAVRAIPTALIECGSIGSGAAVLAGGWIEFRRRRFTRALEGLSRR